MEILSRVLDNGLTVFLVPMAGTKTLTGMFIVRAGTKYQNENEVEIAHFLEHMAFKGTPRRPRTIDITSALEGIGGNCNAFTGTDFIAYYIKVPARHSKLLMNVLSDIILNPLFAPEEIEREKGPVKEELLMAKASPSGNLNYLVMPEMLFGNHTLAGLRTEEDIDKINRGTLLCYFSDPFCGPNAAVAIAGNISNPETFFTRLGQVFHGLPYRVPKRQTVPFVETQIAPRIKIVNQDIPQTLLALCIKCPSIQSPLRGAINLLNVVLGSGMSSRLFTKVRERRGLAYAIRSELDLMVAIGTFSVFAGLNQQRWQEGLRIILEQLRLLRDKGISKKELTRAQNMIFGRLAMASENSEFLAESVAESWALLGEAECLEKKINRIKTVTIDDVRQAAKEILRADRMCIAVAGPHEGEKETILKMLNF